MPAGLQAPLGAPERTTRKITLANLSIGRTWAAFISCILLALLSSCGGTGGSIAAKPNILFVIMDDVGIDQMKVFGYGGLTPPNLPNINAVAAAGVRFRNAWSMPECSPGRAAMFVGRYPIRTNIYAAVGPHDLANSQISPYDMTTPKLLRQSNYESAMFGKFHLAGPENNVDGVGTPAALGWDYFYGWVGGLPASIDSTAGGVSATGTRTCGFVPSLAKGGADTGACYRADNSCSLMAGTAASGDVPGKRCLASGGIFVPNASCQSTPPVGLNFNKQNAYYVSPLVINAGSTVTEVALTDSRARGYRSKIEADAAISWINSRSSSKPWMATVSFSAPHTPLQQAPGNLTPTSGALVDNLDCTNLLDQRVLQNQMTEALDSEFGRILVETGLAKRGADGSLVYDAKASNTMVVIVGDNGTLGNSVKAPFSIQRAKGTAYQTGVWDPLIVAGPLVNNPDREVDHMVNMVDVFQLFGEIAGIDVVAAVPRVIDSAPLLPYLSNANQSSIRKLNFATGGYNIQANGGRNGPCVISGNSCTQIPVSKAVCEDNNGVWWGTGATGSSVVNAPTGYQSCCQVNQALFKVGQAQVTINPDISTAIRNDKYKIVQNTVKGYNVNSDACTSVVTNEFYEVDQAKPIPKLDNADLNLLLQPLSAQLQGIYDGLYAQLTTILASQPPCPGDGNMDGTVDALDMRNWLQVIKNWVLSSVYDFNHDGATNNTDAQTINSHLGPCKKATAIY